MGKFRYVILRIAKSWHAHNHEHFIRISFRTYLMRSRNFGGVSAWWWKNELGSSGIKRHSSLGMEDLDPRVPDSLVACSARFARFSFLFDPFEQPFLDSKLKVFRHSDLVKIDVYENLVLFSFQQD